MGSEACINCDSIFQRELFFLVCKHCNRTLSSFDEFRSHFADFYSQELVCGQLYSERDVKSRDFIKDELPEEDEEDMGFPADDEEQDLKEDLDLISCDVDFSDGDEDEIITEQEVSIPLKSERKRYTQEELASLHPSKLHVLDLQDRIEIDTPFSKKIIDPSREIKDPKAGYKCRVCGLLLATRGESARHFNTSKFKGSSNDFLGLKSFSFSVESCNICAKVIKHREIIKHSKEEHDVILQDHHELPETCDLCNKTFKNKIMYTQHFKTVHSRGSLLHQRKSCHYSSIDPFKVRLHYKKYHDKVDPKEVKYYR